MFCSNCGAETHEFSEICSRCKTPLTVPTKSVKVKNVNTAEFPTGVLIFCCLLGVVVPLLGMFCGICMYYRKATDQGFFVFYSSLIWLIVELMLFILFSPV